MLRFPLVDLLLSTVVHAQVHRFAARADN